jgi:hypothetical protein
MCETLGRKMKHRARVHLVNVSMCKSELYGLLNKDRPAQGDIYPTGWVYTSQPISMSSSFATCRQSNSYRESSKATENRSG